MLIEIDIKVYRKMFAYIKYAPGEVSGLAKVERTEDRDIIRIIDIALFDQICSGASTDINQDDLAKFIDELMVKGEDVGAWKCWWHSHADMGVFWSGTDTNTIASLNPECVLNNYIVSLVGNKKNELLARIDVFEPIIATLDNVETEVTFEDESINNECQAEIKLKVKQPAPIIYCPRQPTYPPLSDYQYESQADWEKRLEKEMIKAESANNFFDPKDICGLDNPPSKYIDSTGVYILGKDGMFHKKLRKLTKAEKAQIKKALKIELKDAKNNEIKPDPHAFDIDDRELNYLMHHSYEY